MEGVTAYGSGPGTGVFPLPVAALAGKDACHSAAVPMSLLDMTPGTGTALEPAQDADAIVDNRRRRLLCLLCANPITDSDKRIDINGRHEHTRTNPAGFSYCFGCFSAAPGCACVGKSSFMHTWFAGCPWQIAVCRGCGEHLGWRFTGAHSFHALILERLVEEKPH